jgi:NNP family nitrate/nitrite transporter-like MFS transporter
MDGRSLALMGIALSALPPVYFLVAPGAPAFTTLLALGVLLGVGGASFAVALPMASSGYSAKVQGLVLGLAAAGNIGAVLDGVLFPPLAHHVGWRWAMVAVLPLLALAAFVVFVWARDQAPKAGSLSRALVSFFGSLLFLVLLVVGARGGWLGLTGHPAVLLLPILGVVFVVALLPPVQRRVLKEPDAWAFFLIYGVTFGGFVGMSAYITLLLISLYHISKIDAGLLMALLAFTGATLRPLGGLIADRITGARTLRYALSGIAAADLIFAFAVPSMVAGRLVLDVIFIWFWIICGCLFFKPPARAGYTLRNRKK